MSFNGRAGEYLGILFKGSLLQIPTFGFYRFWLITKTRRHLWANTTLGGEPFEYVGNAKELLIGFFIAMAVLVPIYILYFILGLMLEELQALASIPLVLLMWVLGHFASYRARAYLASRTVFRGLRFWMKGSGWAYAGKAMLWDLATIFSLGLALPWASAALERYRMRHTYFGTLQGSFTGTGGTLFKRGWWLWAIFVLAPLAITLGIAVVSASSDLEEMPMLSLVPVGWILALFLLTPIFSAVVTKWQIDGLRMGNVSLSSTLRKRSFLGQYFKALGMILVAFLVFGVCAAIYAVAFGSALQGMAQSTTMPDISISAIIVAGLGYLALLMCLGIIVQYFMVRGFWVVIVKSVTAHNLAALDDARAAGQASGSTGEALAMALDVGGAF